MVISFFLIVFTFLVFSLFIFFEYVIKSFVDNNIIISISLYEPTSKKIDKILNILNANKIAYLINDDFDLKPFGVEGRIIITPGHTKCSVSVLLSSEIAIVGDMVVPSFFTGEAVLSYFAEDAYAVMKSVEQLMEQGRVFYGGHGGPFSREIMKKALKAYSYDK